MRRVRTPGPSACAHAGPVAFVVGALLCQGLAARAAAVELAETGSTLIYPVFNVWVADYTRTHAGVTISTGSTGSEAGIAQALSGAVQIGTSDAYMSDTQAKHNPKFINVPMAISALTVNYNLPGLNNRQLKLDGPVLAGMYNGEIRRWDDAAIAALNPGVDLPHHDIVPVHRSDGSGDTFVYSQYLTFSVPSWENGVGYGTSLSWPAVPGALAAAGNSGMLRTLQDTPYSLGYLGVTFQSALGRAQLGTAKLKSFSGEFLVPTPQTIAAAAAALSPRTPADERLTLVDAPGPNAYPLVNYEYAIVSTQQANRATADAVKKFLLWAIAPDEANEKYLDDAHLIPLPAHIWVLSHDQIEKID